MYPTNSSNRPYRLTLSSGKGGEQAPCVGDFTPIRPGEDRDVLERMEHIPCRAGDLVCWVRAAPLTVICTKSHSAANSSISSGLSCSLLINCIVQIQSALANLIVMNVVGLSYTPRKCSFQQLRAAPRRGVHRPPPRSADQQGLC
jgi:hypothetical protein